MGSRDTFGSSSGESRFLPNYLPAKKPNTDVIVAEPLRRLQVGRLFLCFLLDVRDVDKGLWRNYRSCSTPSALCVQLIEVSGSWQLVMLSKVS